MLFAILISRILFSMIITQKKFAQYLEIMQRESIGNSTGFWEVTISVLKSGHHLTVLGT